LKINQFTRLCAYKLQTPGNYPEERIQHSEDESLKSRIIVLTYQSSLETGD